jgi:hypothetical protein
VGATPATTAGGKVTRVAGTADQAPGL